MMYIVHTIAAANEIKNQYNVDWGSSSSILVMIFVSLTKFSGMVARQSCLSPLNNNSRLVSHCTYFTCENRRVEP